MATVQDVISAQVAASTLIAAGIATATSVVLAGEGFDMKSFFDAFLGFGAPTMAAALGTNLLVGSGKDTTEEYAIRGAVGGAAAVAVMMLAGIMPQKLDMAAIVMGATVGGSILLGDFAGKLIHKL